MSTRIVEIRPAHRENAECLASIHEDAWRSTYQGLIPHLQLARMIARRGPGWWQNCLQRDALILLLEFDNKICGYANLGRNRAPRLPYGGEILELYLKPVYQGLGFGRQLFQAARETLSDKGMHGLIVWALEENHQACNFYMHMGGVPVTKKEECFGDRRLIKIGFGWRQ